MPCSSLSACSWQRLKHSVSFGSRVKSRAESRRKATKSLRRRSSFAPSRSEDARAEFPALPVSMTCAIRTGHGALGAWAEIGAHHVTMTQHHECPNPPGSGVARVR
eukprot:876748-Rhodomonas_salina.3